jgi:hypothetical protein
MVYCGGSSVSSSAVKFIFPDFKLNDTSSFAGSIKSADELQFQSIKVSMKRNILHSGL